MLFSELAGLTAKDLNKKKVELRSKLFEARMKNSLGQLANPMVIREARKDIARINTVLAKLGKTAAPAAKTVAKKVSKAAGTSKSVAKKSPRVKKG
ncbi:MAG: 50S ribosomal protein L29 [Bdellovibrionaceae bacterium]|jgi:large subunit ribosomal protein L29|nr:50S ribosomal protein L29 [Pseudobdellovibrionaceae bacterium]